MRCNHPDETPDSQETRGDMAMKKGTVTMVKVHQEVLLLMLPVAMQKQERRAW